MAPEVWKMIRERGDLHFVIITKRIHRFQVGLPKDWGEGYDNVTICCTCENQNRADYRLPIFLNLPIRHRTLIHEPMLERIEQTGAKFKKGNRIYHIERKDQMNQAEKAGVNYRYERNIIK